MQLVVEQKDSEVIDQVNLMKHGWTLEIYEFVKNHTILHITGHGQVLEILLWGNDILMTCIYHIYQVKEV